MARLLTNIAANAKTQKEMASAGVEGVILHLAAATNAGEGYNVCAEAVRQGCADACLVHAGRGAFPSVIQGRARKTRAYFDDRGAFVEGVARELSNLEARAARKGLRPIARLDGTSDIGLAARMADRFPAITFWDYTKIQPRMRRWLAAREAGRLSNWWLTFSLGAQNERAALAYLRQGANVAVPFRLGRSAALPATWQGFDVIDGDRSDFRFLDPSSVGTGRPGVVVGLRAKGSAMRDAGGFVREAA